MGKILQIDVFGKVQGVWFRKYTKQKADELEIQGTVQNMPDGSVRIHAMAEAANLASFLDWCEIGSPKAEVSEIITKEIDGTDFHSFEIIR